MTITTTPQNRPEIHHPKVLTTAIAFSFARGSTATKPIAQPAVEEVVVTGSYIFRRFRRHICRITAYQ